MLAVTLSTSASFIKPSIVRNAGTYTANFQLTAAAHSVAPQCCRCRTMKTPVWINEHVLFDTQYQRTPAGKYEPALRNRDSLDASRRRCGGLRRMQTLSDAMRWQRQSTARLRTGV
jgi:hypothetical protein